MVGKLVVEGTVDGDSLGWTDTLGFELVDGTELLEGMIDTVGP